VNKLLMMDRRTVRNM